MLTQRTASYVYCRAYCAKCRTFQKLSHNQQKYRRNSVASVCWASKYPDLSVKGRWAVIRGGLLHLTVEQIRNAGGIRRFWDLLMDANFTQNRYTQCKWKGDSNVLKSIDGALVGAARRHPANINRILLRAFFENLQGSTAELPLGRQ